MKKTLLTIFLAAATFGASAADFFSTAESEQFFSIGARIGVNTSNRTMDNNSLPNCYHNEGWGTGFELGAVANLNIRDYLTIQPGFFFESRSGRFTATGDPDGAGLGMGGFVASRSGKRNSYNFTVPVMALVNFNVTDELRWSVEAGPYVAFVLGSKMKTEAAITESASGLTLPLPDKAAGVDFGFKLGTSLQLYSHWYAGVHYMAGCVGAWKDLTVGNMQKSYGGVTKAWTFTIGYDF